MIKRRIEENSACRDRDRADAGFFETSLRDAAGSGHCPWIGFDEIHKMPRWKDILKGYFELNYVRMRDGKETDFLIVRDGKPWILFEAKLEDGPIDKHHFDHARMLGNIPFIQVVRNGRVFRKQDPGAFRISASRLFA